MAGRADNSGSAYNQVKDFGEYKGHMRLFTAILLNDEMKNALLNMQDGMRERGVLGNFIPEENMHLTVAFIGDYSDPQNVLDVIDDSAFRPVKLQLDGIGSFGELWYAGLQENKALYAYVKRLRHGLANAGIPFDRKRFTPHIPHALRQRKTRHDLYGDILNGAGRKEHHT